MSRNKDTIKLVGGVPWRANPQDLNVDGEGMKLDVTVMDQHHGPAEGSEGVGEGAVELLPEGATLRVMAAPRAAQGASRSSREERVWPTVKHARPA